MNPGTHPTIRTRPVYHASLAEPTHQQVEVVRETERAVQLRYCSDSEHGEGEVTAWFPRGAVRLVEHEIYGLTCTWTADWIARKLAAGDHRAVIEVAA